MADYNRLLQIEKDHDSLTQKVASDGENIVLMQVQQVEYIPDTKYYGQYRCWIPRIVIQNASLEVIDLVTEMNRLQKKNIDLTHNINELMDKKVPFSIFSRKVKDLK